MAELRLTRRAKKDLEALPVQVRKAVVETLVLIEAEPEARGKELVGPLAGLSSARVGSYRVLYTIERHMIIVRSIRHRGVVYRARRRRR